MPLPQWLESYRPPLWVTWVFTVISVLATLANVLVTMAHLTLDVPEAVPKWRGWLVDIQRHLPSKSLLNGFLIAWLLAFLIILFSAWREKRRAIRAARDAEQVEIQQPEPEPMASEAAVRAARQAYRTCFRPAFRFAYEYLCGDLCSDALYGTTVENESKLKYIVAVCAREHLARDWDNNKVEMRFTESDSFTAKEFDALKKEIAAAASEYLGVIGAITRIGPSLIGRQVMEDSSRFRELRQWHNKYKTEMANLQSHADTKQIAAELGLFDIVLGPESQAATPPPADQPPSTAS